MNSTSKPCPDQQTLLQFIQGRLEPPTLDQCEDHVSGCESCHETLRGLDTNDTLSHYVSEALQQQPSEDQSDTKAIDGLMQRLLQPGGAGRPSAIRSSSNVEIMADRAAEVLRCVEPPAIDDEDSLGTLGDYRLLRLIGAGGTGVVFQAKDMSLDRIVALKVLRPSLGDIARDRFIAEARLAASIEHDNVVTIYQIGQEGRLAFIAMQWLPGETLEARLDRESSTLSEETVRELVTQIASGLSAAHERQLIHRDIKPANIWICEDTGRIKILDFGLARIADEESSLTQTGMLAGTPSFMSPEQTKGMELDPRSDLFSLGCVMYKLLTGRLPFSAPTVLGTLQTIQSDSPKPPIAVNAECGSDLSDLTMSLLEKLPGNRMATAENLIACLNNKRSNWPQSVAVVSGKVLAAGPAKALAPTTQRPSSSGIRWLIAASLAGILGITGWLMAPQIFRIVTDQGELIVETSDPNIKIEVLENGDLFRVLDASSKDSFDIKSGKYSFNVVSKDNQSKFEVTPKSVTMTRGGKQLVSVTISHSETPTPRIANNPVSPSETYDVQSPAGFMSNLLAAKRKINETYGESASPEKRKAEQQAAIAALRVQRDQLAENVGTGHPSTQSIDSQIASIERHFRSLPTTDEQPIYGGRNFRQWLRIARNDREPKTVADAIAACGVLAEGEQKKLFLDHLRKLVRKHGTANSQEVTNGGVSNTANIYATGFLKGINQLKPGEVADFIQSEMDSGNERSLGFCTTIFSYLDFDGDRNKTLEFHNTVALDTNPLMNRICARDIDFDSDVTSFLNSCFRSSKNVANLSTCLKTVTSLEVAKRPELYSALLPLFRNGELDDAIKVEFFADSTPASVRESYVQRILYGPTPYGHGGFESKIRHSLAVKILTEAIARMLAANGPELKFDTYQEIWFDQNRVVDTSKDANGNIYWTNTDGSVSFAKTKPDGVEKIQGKAAIVRHLLTKLCHAAIAETLENEDRDLVLDFVKETIDSQNKAIEDLLDSPDFQELKIEKDLKNLRDVANGEKKGDAFTRFTKVPNSMFGRGAFGGGGGGVF